MSPLVEHEGTEEGAISADGRGWFQWVAIGVVLALATLVRLIGLEEDLWLDEILTWVNYGDMPLSQIVTTYDSQNQHILYSALARVSRLGFGATVWSLRLPAVAFGVAGIWALWSLGREVALHAPPGSLTGLRRTTEPVLAAAFLAFSYHHVWFSQNARGYTGLLFWSLLSTWFFLRALRTGQVRDWVGFALSVALGVYTHLTMLFVVMGQFLAFGLALLGKGVSHATSGSEMNQSSWTRGFGYGFCLGGVFTLLLYAPVMGQLFQGLTGEEGNVATWKNPLWTILEFARGLRIGLSGAAVGLTALFPFALGVSTLWRRSPPLVMVVLAPPFLGTTITLAMDHYVWPRFYFFAFGFIVLIVIAGAFDVAELTGRALKWSGPRSHRVGVGLSLALILFSAASVPRAWGPKQAYHRAFDYVTAHHEPNDAVVTVGLATFPFERWIGADWLAATNGAELDEIRAAAPRTWAVYTLPLHLQGEYPDIAERLKDDFQEVGRFVGTLNGGDIVICRYDRPPR